MGRKVKRWKSKDHSNQLDQASVARGKDRELFFAEGGTAAEWRGIRTVQKDRKKDRSKNACRGRVKRDRW